MCKTKNAHSDAENSVAKSTTFDEMHDRLKNYNFSKRINQHSNEHFCFIHRRKVFDIVDQQNEQNKKDNH